MDTEKIASQVFWHSYEKAQTGVKNWCFYVMKMFDDLECGLFKDKNNCFSKQAVLSSLDDALVDKNKKTWSQNVNRIYTQRGSRNKLRTYCKFKTTFETEMYLQKPMAFKMRQAFAKLRCGVAPLRIETGRYEKLPLDQRTCQACNHDVLEDEMHFLISCIAYREERNSLFNMVSQILPDFIALCDEDKFIVLMNEPTVCKFTARA